MGVMREGGASAMGTSVRRAATAVVGSLMLVSCVAAEVESGGQAGSSIASAQPADGPAFSDGEQTSTPGTAPASSSTVPVATSTTTPTTPTTSTTSTTTTTTTTAAPLVGWDAVDAYLRTTIVGGGSDAVSAAVMEDGDLVYAVAHGARSPGGDEAALAEHRFRIASISKMVTAITMLQLVEEGLVGLDDPIVGLVAAGLGAESIPAEVANITVRQLLTHRSGFPQYEKMFFRNEVASCDEAAQVGVTSPLQSVPGTAFQYSNFNFCLAGLAIEVLTGQLLSDAVDQRLLAPLGITSMRLAGTFDVAPFDIEHRSTAGRNYMETLAGAGSWIATAADVVAITNSLDLATPGWKPLDAPTVELVRTITLDPPVPASAPDDPAASTTTTAPPPAPTTGYGMGLMIFGPGTFGHTGTIESTHAMTVRRPDGLTWAVTVSGEYPSSTRALADIMNNALLLGGFIDGNFVTPPAAIEP